MKYQITDHDAHIDGHCNCEVRRILSEYVWCEPVAESDEDVIVLRPRWALSGPDARYQGATTAYPLS